MAKIIISSSSLCTLSQSSQSYSKSSIPARKRPNYEYNVNTSKIKHYFRHSQNSFVGQYLKNLSPALSKLWRLSVEQVDIWINRLKHNPRLIRKVSMSMDIVMFTFLFVMVSNFFFLSCNANKTDSPTIMVLWIPRVIHFHPSSYQLEQ